MPTYTLTGRITPEHTLVIRLPADSPVGEARVVVTVQASPEAEASGNASVKALLEMAAEWKLEPPSTRTDAEIEAYIQEARNSWD